MRRAVAAGLALVSMLLAAAPALAEKRVALVVGNDVYPGLPADQQLRRAVNDARAVGEALGRLGFKVLRGENLDRRALVDKFDEMAAQLSPGDTAFFFFAGHGVSIGGGNYILPVDVPNVTPGQETRLARAALGENEIVTDLQGRGVRVAVVVLDACRNNPFRRPGTRAIGAERGLARSEAVRGVFSLYSAGVGQTALDRLGDDDRHANSVFTRVLVPALGRPGLDLSTLAVEVREEVARLASTVGHDQRPAYYDETIGGRVYLAGAGGPAAGSAAAQDRNAQAQLAWSLVQNTTDLAVLRAFDRQYADTSFGALARGRIAELTRNQGVAALTAPQPAAPVTRRLLDVESIKPFLPGDMQVDPEVLRALQTDAFFANAPPVKLRSYRIRRVANGATEEFAGAFRALGNGLAVHQSGLENRQEGRKRNMIFLTGPVMPIAARDVLETGAADSRKEPEVSAAKVIKLDQLKGSLFPMARGNQVEFRFIMRFVPDRNARGDWENNVRCVVDEQLPAVAFHRNLKGDAFVIRCENRHSRSTSRTETVRQIYFGELGVNLVVDAIDPAVFRDKEGAHRTLVDFTLAE